MTEPTFLSRRIPDEPRFSPAYCSGASMADEPPEDVADSAVHDLAEALTRAGLPPLASLRGVVTFGGRPHVELGGARAEAVAVIAAWIRERAR